MSEHQEQAAVIDWWGFQYPSSYGCLFSIPNGAQLAGDVTRRVKQVNKLKSEGMLPGVSDLFLMISSGDYNGLFIEMKDDGRTRCSVSTSQWDHIYLAREHGFRAEWCAGAEEAINLIKDYLEGTLGREKD